MHREKFCHCRVQGEAINFCLLLYSLCFSKAVIAVLVKNYEFEFRDGRNTNPEIEVVKPLLPRPKLKGEAEVAVPLRIRRIEAN